MLYPNERGLEGHSDADAIAHAAADALLGAAGLGDLGQHFPDTDPAFAGVDSLSLLATVAGMVRAAGWEIGNVDVSVVCEVPRLRPEPRGDGAQPVRGGRRAGDGEGPAGRGPRRARPPRRHRLLGRRRHHRGVTSPPFMSALATTECTIR